MNEYRKNHYIPKFYLKRWSTAGTLVEFRRPYRDVKPRRTSPEGTGYRMDLYSIPGLPPDEATKLEAVFMKPTDSLAADALAQLSVDGARFITPRMRRAWARSIMSMLMRTPEEVARFRTTLREHWDFEIERLRTEYDTFRQSQDPTTYEEMLQRINHAAPEIAASNLLIQLSTQQGLDLHLENMVWRVRRLPKANLALLTSDRPIFRSGGMGHENALMIMPIGPDRLFYCVHNDDADKKLRETPDREVVKLVNRTIVEQAVDYVYGVDDSSLTFVERYLRKRSNHLLPPTEVGGRPDEGPGR